MAPRAWFLAVAIAAACGGRSTPSRPGLESACDDCIAGSGGTGQPALAGSAGEGGGASSGGGIVASGSGGAGDAAQPAEGGKAEPAGGAPATGGADALEGGETGCQQGASRFVTRVVEHTFGGSQNFNQEGFPEALYGPPEANEPRAVVSLGNGGWVVLAFDGNAIVDGPGVDFTVFENALPKFQELASVAVSDDGVHWVELPCTAEPDADDFGDCAGIGRVFSSTSNGIDPLDPSTSGGDHYDLADFHLARARYVRITDRADLTGLAGVFDLDAVAVVNAECP